VTLHALADRLRASKGFAHKVDIQSAYAGLGNAHGSVRVGDDTAALPDGDGYLLFAIEGLLEEFVRAEPWFAGYCGVMVNLSDVAAMGGRPLAVVDAMWSAGAERAALIWDGMRAAAMAYDVPIVGGHTNVRSDGGRLAVAVSGPRESLADELRCAARRRAARRHRSARRISVRIHIGIAARKRRLRNCAQISRFSRR